MWCLVDIPFVSTDWWEDRGDEYWYSESGLKIPKKSIHTVLEFHREKENCKKEKRNFRFSDEFLSSEGWITPEGKFIEVPKTGGDFFLRKVFDIDAKDLKKKGWIKINSTQLVDIIQMTKQQRRAYNKNIVKQMRQRRNQLEFKETGEDIQHELRAKKDLTT